MDDEWWLSFLPKTASTEKRGPTDRIASTNEEGPADDPLMDVAKNSNRNNEETVAYISKRIEGLSDELWELRGLLKKIDKKGGHATISAFGPDQYVRNFAKTLQGSQAQPKDDKKSTSTEAAKPWGDMFTFPSPKSSSKTTADNRGARPNVWGLRTGPHPKSPMKQQLWSPRNGTGGARYSPYASHHKRVLGKP